MPRKPSHILFDLDGTLVDSKPGIFRCFSHTISHFGRPIPEDAAILALIGLPLSKAVAKLIEARDEKEALQALKIYRDEYAVRGMYEAEVYPDIIAALSKLKSPDRRLFVATAKNERISRKIIPHFGLHEYFQQVYGGQEDERLTEKPDLIAHILKVEGIDPEDCIMVGDRNLDVIGAKANGMRCIGVTYGFGGRIELEVAGADYLADSPLDLLKILT